MTNKQYTKSELEALQQEAAMPHDFSHEIKVGDKIRLKPGSFYDRRYNVFEAVVTEVQKWEDEPLSAENHGSIEIKMTKVSTIDKTTEYLKPGDLEHFCYWKWYRHLEVIQ